MIDGAQEEETIIENAQEVVEMIDEDQKRKR